ncbi:Adenylate kinase isoenzyme 1 [Sarracenia purpurea var. burkii]
MSSSSKFSGFGSFFQYDAFDIGFITTGDFTYADILEATYPAIAERLRSDWINDSAIPIVTVFLGKVFQPVVPP